MFISLQNTLFLLEYRSGAWRVATELLIFLPFPCVSLMQPEPLG